VNGAATLDREEISAKQAAVADRLLLTKTDLASPPPALLRRLTELNATAPVVIARHGEIDLHDFLDGRVYDPRTGSLDVRSWLGPEPGAHEHRHGHDGIETYALVRRKPLRAVTLTLFLETLAEHCGSDLLRLKGIVNILESPERPAVIHGVQHVFHPPTWLSGWPSEDQRSRMIFITRGIPRRWVEALLAALEAEVADVSAEMPL
jgi:G3E family GTPase